MFPFIARTEKILYLTFALTACGPEPVTCGSHHGHDGPMCAGRVRGPITLDASFSAQDQTAIIAAGDAWGDATGGRVALTWAIVEPGESPTVFAACLGPDIGGQYRGDTGRISLCPEKQPLGMNAQHELGHYFGLGHTDEPGALMYAYSGAWLGPADVEHFDRVAAGD